MTEAESLKTLEVIIDKGGLEEDMDEFYHSHIRALNISQLDYQIYVEELIHQNYLDDEELTINTSIHRLYQSLKSQLDEQKQSKLRQRNESRLTNWQVKTYWLNTSIGVVGVVLAIIALIGPGLDEAQYIKKSELEEMLKEYTRQEKHEKDLMELHDLIYKDTTLLNNK